MNNNINVGVAGVITGGNNIFNQNNHHHHNNSGSGSGNKGKSADDSAGIGFAAFFGAFMLTTVAARYYLIHFETIIYWLFVGTTAGVVPHMLKLACQAFDDSYRYQDSLGPLSGVALAGALAWMIGMTAAAMPQEVLAAAAQPLTASGIFQQAIQMWNLFTSSGHRLILENMGSGAVFLVFGVVFNLLFGLQQSIQALGRALNSTILAAIARGLNIFKIAGPIVATASIALAYLTLTGFWPSLMA